VFGFCEPTDHAVDPSRARVRVIRLKIGGAEAIVAEAEKHRGEGGEGLEGLGGGTAPSSKSSSSSSSSSSSGPPPPRRGMEGWMGWKPVARTLMAMEWTVEN